jgi:glycerophosphoryl diester phosphodiesterase
LKEAARLIAAAWGMLARSWKPLAAADLLYKAIAFTVLAPLTTLLLHLLVAWAGLDVVADQDIALFFVTTRPGAAALILVSALGLAIHAVGQASLMTIALAARRGACVRVREAFAATFARAVAIVLVALRIVVRVLALVAPFLVAVGLTYWLLLGSHDINFYLKDQPPVFWVAVAVAAAVLIAGAAIVLPRIASWLLAMPILVFEGVGPSRALRLSAERMAGIRRAAGLVLAAWAGAGLLIPAAAWAALAWIGALIAPALGRSLPRLLLFIGVVALVWSAVLLANAILSASFLALLSVALHERTGAPAELRLPAGGSGEVAVAGGRWRLSWRSVACGLAAALMLATGAAYLGLRAAWVDRPVLVIAHRGASGRAPENTLAAFRRAIEERADMVELDVQESSDGVVVVVHDSDLMKVGGSPLVIWETPAAELRQVDIGSRFSSEFGDERVPTLAEALAVCKGKVRVDIELKSYGHDDRLEERVVELVESAGVEDQVVTMSLDHDMVRTMERLRPEWTAGVLTARAMGDLTEMPADFLAVQVGMATRRFVRRAHRAGKAVYVWTLNDPAQMLEAMAVGVDGLITDQPALARGVVERREAMDPAERLLVALLVRFGRRTDLVPTESELRP